MRVWVAPAVNRCMSFSVSEGYCVRLTIGGESGEPLGIASELEVLGAGSGGEASGLVDSGLGSGDDIGAINQGALIVAEKGKLDHSRTKLKHHRGVIESEVLEIASGG